MVLKRKKNKKIIKKAKTSWLFLMLF